MVNPLEPTSSTPPNSSGPSPPLSPEIFNSQIAPNHVASLIPLKLTKDNYLLWKDVTTLVLQNYDLYSLVDGSEVSPPVFIGTQANPNYPLWLKKDRTCRLWLTASLSESILPFTVGTTTARSLWLILERRFAAVTRSHVLQLKRRIQTIRKGSLSISEFLQQIKAVSDALAAAGEPLADADLVAHILHGLTPDYEAFTTSVRVRAEPVTPDELHGLLLSQEIELDHQAAQQSLLQPLPQAQAFAVTTNRPRTQSRGPFNSFRSNTRPRFPNPSSSLCPSLPTSNPPLLPNPPFPRNSAFRHNPAHPKPRCQICGMLNHTALNCYNRWNHSYQGRVPPARLAAMATPSRRPQFTAPTHFNPAAFTDSFTSEDPSESLWYIDSGATNHITSDLANLNIHNEYSGTDQVSVANGQGSSVGESSLSRAF